MEKRVYYIKKVVLESTNNQDLKLCVCVCARTYYLFIFCVLNIYNKLKISGWIRKMTQTSMWKQKRKDYYSQRWCMARSKLSCRHDKIIRVGSHMSSQRLEEHAQYLHMFKLDKYSFSAIIYHGSWDFLIPIYFHN